MLFVTVKTYLSPVETHCNNINYYFSDENNETRDFTDDAWARLRKYLLFNSLTLQTLHTPSVTKLCQIPDIASSSNSN